MKTDSIKAINKIVWTRRKRPKRNFSRIDYLNAVDFVVIKQGFQLLYIAAERIHSRALHGIAGNRTIALIKVENVFIPAKSFTEENCGPTQTGPNFQNPPRLWHDIENRCKG